MKSRLLDFSGGVNCIVDKTMTATNFVSVLDNAHLRSGAINSFALPGFVQFDSVGVQQIFAYRGRFWTSANYRSYVAEFTNGIERVYYTEYGTNASKAIEGTVVKLGLAAPNVQPTVDRGLALTPSNVVVTKVGGNYTVNRTLSYRLAFETEDGVAPPSGKVVVQTTADNQGAYITWSAPSPAIKAKKVVIFGTNEDKEQRIAEVNPSQTYYTDIGAAGVVGEFASAYDQIDPYTYVYTFVRRVNGVENESAPSALSKTITSAVGRLVTLDIANDGFWSSTNLVQYDRVSTAPGIVASTGLGVTYNMSAFAVDASDGRVKFTLTSTNVDFVDGETLIFEGFSDANYNNKIKTIRITPASGNQAFYTDDTVAPTDGSPAGRTVRRIITATISGTSGSIKAPYYDTIVGGIRFTTTSAHGLSTGDKGYFTNFSDAYWNNQTFEVVVPAGSTTQFIVKGVPVPSDAAYTTQAVNKAWTKVNMTSSSPLAGFVTMVKDDTVYLNLVNGGTTYLSGYYKAKVVSVPTNPGLMYFIVQAYTTGSMTPTTSSIVKFVPHNDYIVYRRLYRSGDTTVYAQVYDLTPEMATYNDAKSVTRLGDPIPSFYTDNGVDVLFDIPPLGAENLTSHYGMMFCVTDHTVRWTPINYPDAWPQVFSMTFAFKPTALTSFAQGLIVLCEDALYRIDGNDPTTLTLAKTHAEDGCIAPFTVQKTNAGLVYLSKLGLMLFDGDTARCITDMKVLGKWLNGPAFTNAGVAPFWWLPSSWSKLFQDMSKADGLASDPYAPHCLSNTMPQNGINRGVRSFYHQGRYFLFWPDGVADYTGHSTLCIDLQTPGMPITTLGFKPVDVCVDDMDEAYCLLQDVPTMSLTITVV